MMMCLDKPKNFLDDLVSPQEKKSCWNNFWDTQPKFRRHMLIFCVITMLSIGFGTLGAALAATAEVEGLVDSSTGEGSFAIWCGDAAVCINRCTELLAAYRNSNKRFVNDLPWVALGTALVCGSLVMLFASSWSAGCQKKNRPSAHTPIADSLDTDFTPGWSHAISSSQSFKECLSPTNVKLHALKFLYDHRKIVSILHLLGVTAFITLLARVSTSISGAIIDNRFATSFPEGVCVPSNTTDCATHCVSILRKADHDFSDGVGYGFGILLTLSIAAVLIQLALAGTFSAVPTLTKSAWNKCTGKENLPEEGGMPRATTKLTAPNNHRAWLCCKR